MSARPLRAREGHDRAVRSIIPGRTQGVISASRHWGSDNERLVRNVGRRSNRRTLNPRLRGEGRPHRPTSPPRSQESRRSMRLQLPRSSRGPPLSSTPCGSCTGHGATCHQPQPHAHCWPPAPRWIPRQRHVMVLPPPHRSGRRERTASPAPARSASAPPPPSAPSGPGVRGPPPPRHPARSATTPPTHKITLFVPLPLVLRIALRVLSSSGPIHSPP